MASAKACRLTISEAEVTTPASAASMTPMLTPREIPKSSALIMSRGRSGVDLTRAVAANASEIDQHPGAVSEKRNGDRLVAVVEVHRNLFDFQMVEACDEQTLEVEPESFQCLSREDDLRRARTESLQPGLGVQNAG